MERPAILFLYERPAREDWFDPCFLWQAAAAGFRSYAVSWRSVQVSEGQTRIRGGFEAISPRGKRFLRAWEPVQPSVVLHRMVIWGPSADLIARLAQAYPRALISYHPLWEILECKWTTELCFRAGDLANVRVPRPATQLVENGEIRTALEVLGRSRPLIFKPSYGSQGNGIRLSTPLTFDAIAARLPYEGWSRHVVQEIVDDPVLYRKRRFVLRVYALVTSLDPLRYMVYREGVVRIAAAEFDPAHPADYSRVMTTWSFLRRDGGEILNISISELLDDLRGQMRGVERFWEHVDALHDRVFRCLRAQQQDHNLQGRFLLAGTDIMMVRWHSSFELLFLESNVNYPGVWARPADQKFHGIYKAWFADLMNLCGVRPAARQRTSSCAAVQ